MEIYTSFIFFLFGIIFGSFFMVIGIRLPQKFLLPMNVLNVPHAIISSHGMIISPSCLIFF